MALNRTIFSRTSLLERLSELSIPTLILVGQEDRARPPHEAQAMASAIQGAEYVVIPNAGHLPNIEQPQVVNQVLQDFL